MMRRLFGVLVVLISALGLAQSTYFGLQAGLGPQLGARGGYNFEGLGSGWGIQGRVKTALAAGPTFFASASGLYRFALDPEGSAAYLGLGLGYIRLGLVYSGPGGSGVITGSALSAEIPLGVEWKPTPNLGLFLDTALAVPFLSLEPTPRVPSISLGEILQAAFWFGIINLSVGLNIYF